MVTTIPGTEINVTPEMAAPIIASVASAHGADRLPVKNPALSDLRPAKYDTANNRMK